MAKQNVKLSESINSISSTDNTKLKVLYSLMVDAPAHKRPRLILINEFELLVCDGINLSYTSYAHPHGEIANLSLDRGHILDVFSKIEFLLNIMLTNFVRPYCSLAEFDKLMDRIELFSKIRILNDYKILDGPLMDKLVKVRDVRNGFAHKWSERDITYKGKSITDTKTFSEFKKTMLEIWVSLVEINSSIQPDIENLIRQFDPTKQVKSVFDT